jgi:Flp pilus assembly protein TadG
MLAALTQKPTRGAQRLRSSRAFVRCRKGATAVEFALVAAPFFAVLVAILQTALVFYAGRVLDEITEEATRYVMTGQAQTASMSQTQFGNYLCTSANTATLVTSLFTCGKFMINVQSYGSFAAANTTTPTISGFNVSGQALDSTGKVIAWSWSPGNPGDIVVAQVMYPWPIVLAPLGFNLSNLSNGNRLLISTAVFKNEPY